MIYAAILIIGLILLLGGADFLIRGASGLARRLGVPPLVIGLTIVAFGTSAPEFAINVHSAVAGETDLAFGNIVGACLVAISFVLGITALIKPLKIQTSVISREIPMQVLAAGMLYLLAADALLGGENDNRLSRQDGVVLLMLFAVFLYYTTASLIRARRRDAFVEEVDRTYAKKRSDLAVDAARLLGGLAGVAGGGRLVVVGAVGLAETIGVSDTVIGLTIVSLGTTMPELATGISAVCKGHSDIAVGNVVGSCIFNILFVGGTVASISPIAIPLGGEADLIALLCFSLLLLPISLWGQNLIQRSEAIALLLLYGGYLTLRWLLWA